MKKNYWYAILTYFVTLFTLKGVLYFIDVDIHTKAIVNFIVFPIILVIFFFLLKKDLLSPTFEKPQSSIGKSILWILLGFLLVLLLQKVIVLIQVHLLGRGYATDPTDSLVRALPILIVIGSVIAPIVEEIIFRKILLGSLMKRYNTLLSVIVSSLIFSLIHMNLNGFFNIFVMSLVFSSVFIKTNRLLVPATIHIMVNLLLFLVSLG